MTKFPRNVRIPQKITREMRENTKHTENYVKRCANTEILQIAWKRQEYQWFSCVWSVKFIKGHCGPLAGGYIVESSPTQKTKYLKIHVCVNCCKHKVNKIYEIQENYPENCPEHPKNPINPSLCRIYWINWTHRIYSIYIYEACKLQKGQKTF